MSSLEYYNITRKYVWLRKVPLMYYEERLAQYRFHWRTVENVWLRIVSSGVLLRTSSSG